MIKHRIAPTLLALYVILGSWKGYIALFEAGKEEPRQIFPTKADSLPEKDRLALEEGIVVRNEKALQRLLEDYLS